MTASSSPPRAPTPAARATPGATTGTTAEGKRVDVDGCDLFTFAGDKIALKSSYFKTRTA